MLKLGDIDKLYKQRLSDDDFLNLSYLIETEYGIKMPENKKEMLEARLRKRLRMLGFDSFTQYCDYLFTQEGMEVELVHMLDVVTTNKTDFFRGEDHFEFMVQQVLPEMISVEGAGINRDLMIWSAGCSTGEEAYTLAIVLNEFRYRVPGLQFRFRILGTDLSSRVLDAAARAVYSEEKLKPVPMNLQRQYLMRSKDPNRRLLRIVPEVRQQVKFRRLNFLDGDFGLREPMDIVFYRNVMIYFKRPTQKEILTKIIRCIRPGGYLFIGHSETLSGLELPVHMVVPTIYRKP